MKKFVFTLIIMVMAMSGFGVVLILTPDIASEYTPHDPIQINENSDFAWHAANEGWAGDGTSTDPYIIEGYEIVASSRDGLRIRSTDSYFEIRDSRIINGGSKNSGISLEEVENGSINNCILENNKHGIYLYSSRGIVITNNTMIFNGIGIRGFDRKDWDSHVIDTSNTVDGKPVYYWKNQFRRTVPPGAGQVILFDCDTIYIENQELNNGSNGIILGYCWDIYIRSNTISSNILNGIYLMSSPQNYITGNIISSNGWDGIYLSYSYRNVISGNTISMNGDDGVDMSIYSDDNLVLENNVSLNHESGIYFNNGDENNITGNVISLNSKYGIEILFSEANIINDNNILSNEKGGIRLHDSSETSMSGNSMIDNGIRIGGGPLEELDTNNIDTTNTINNRTIYYLKNQVGGTVPSNAGQIFLVNCTNVRIEDTEISHLSVGVQLFYSSNNTITNNSFNFNNQEGIYLWNSSENIITGNTVSNNAYGIVLTHSSENTITFNTVSSNSIDGISFHRSTDNILHHNNIIDNDIHLYPRHSMNIWEDGNGRGNYWSDYDGIDWDGDGVGDTNLPHQDVDNHPLTRPVGIGEDGNIPLFSIIILLLILFPIIIFIAIAFLHLMKRKKQDKTQYQVVDDKNILEQAGKFNGDDKKPPPPQLHH